MGKLKFKRGNKAFIDGAPIVDGQLLWNTETGETFEDVEDKRIKTGSNVTIDSTLTKEGEAADAKATGDAIDGKVNAPVAEGTAGQVLANDGAGGTEWSDAGTPTDAQTENAVNKWMDAHPDVVNKTAVLYTEQNLTEPQREQARQNIDTQKLLSGPNFFTAFETPVNLFNRTSDKIRIGYFLTSKGEYAPQSNASVTHPIFVEKGKTYKMTYNAAGFGEVQAIGGICDEVGNVKSVQNGVYADGYMTITPEKSSWMVFNMCYSKPDTFMVCEEEKYPAAYKHFEYDFTKNFRIALKPDQMAALIAKIYSDVLGSKTETGNLFNIYPQNGTYMLLKGTGKVEQHGKNFLKFPYSYPKEITIKGLKITTNENGSVTFSTVDPSGATGTVNFEFAPSNGWTLPEGDYIISGLPEGQGLQQQFVVGGGEDLPFKQGTDLQFHVPANATKLGNCIMQFYKGAKPNFTVYPQIERGYVRTDYEEYHKETHSVSGEKSIKAFDGINILTCDSSFEVIYTPANPETIQVLERGNPLNGKTALFTGDSICGAGVWETGGGWAARIANANNMLYKNYGIHGATVCDLTGFVSPVPASIEKSIDKMISEYPNRDAVDYIVLEGGTNDADNIVQKLTPERFGTFDLIDYSGNYDKTTFCGAFESMIYKATSNFKNAKIGYIVAQKMGKSGIGYDAGEEWPRYRKKYFDEAMKICKKWGISVLNLWDNCHLCPSIESHYDSTLDQAGNIAAKSLYVDGQHLTNQGYDYISPIIEEWMRTL